jgi:molecular chaperone IbpA
MFPAEQADREPAYCFSKENMTMQTIDFSPLFRSTVGFDRMQRLLDGALRTEEGNLSYPPYNIEARGEDAYRITMAVAGFDEGDLDITAKENTLTVSGKARQEDEKTVFLHRGIAGRSFTRHFQLADHIRAAGAELKNGLLHIDLVRELPETMKPRKITIQTMPDGTVAAKAA